MSNRAEQTTDTRMLEVSGLEGGYTRAPVLRHLSLTVAADEVVGLLGANGAGKTTLLRALSGSLPVCRGEVVLDGVALGRKPSWVRAAAGLAHVPEGRHVFRAMTVRENLDVAALVARDGIGHDEVFRVFPRLAERQDQLAGSLSGGEQQMLAIGRALLTGPRLLAIDEMSAGLAPVLVEQLVDGLHQLRGRGIGILLVEQSPHFIADIVDRVYLLEQGRIVGEGTLDELGGADRLAELYLGVS
jgi:branched-chain amino acid transport system ATP-binding protein